MKKKLIGLLLVCTMAVSLLGGCGSSETGTSDTAEETAEEETAAEETSDTAEEKVTAEEAVKESASSTDEIKEIDIDALEDVSEPVTLSLMVTTRPSTDDKDFFLDWLPEMIHERFPNITIEPDQLPSDDYKQNVRMKFASGEGPDLFTWWPQMQAQDLVDAGYVKEVTDFPLLENFNQSIVADYTYDGKTYALPLGVSFLCTWYNADIFKEVGVEVPYDWESFMDVCAKIKDAGYTPIVCGDNDAFVIQFAAYQIAASTVYADNMDFDKQLYTGETSFTDGQWDDALQKLADLYENGYVIDASLGISQEQSRQTFIDGKAAMIFDGSFGYTTLMSEGAGGNFERGVFSLPGNDAGETQCYNLTPSNGMFASAQGDELHQQAIDLVLQYMFSPNSPLFEKWTEYTTDIICYSGVSDQRELISNYMDTYADLGLSSVYNCNNEWLTGVSDEMTSVFQEVISGDAEVADVTAAMQEKFEELQDE